MRAALCNGFASGLMNNKIQAAGKWQLPGWYYVRRNDTRGLRGASPCGINLQAQDICIFLIIQAPMDVVVHFWS